MEQATSQFQVGVGDGAPGVGIGDKEIGDSLGPAQPPNHGLNFKKSLDGSLLAFLRRASHYANTLRFHPPCPLLHEDCGVF